MGLRRWSATVNGAPIRRHHEPGYLEVRRVPTVETQGPGLGVTPCTCGVFRVEVREARTVHIVRRTLMGASAVGLAAVLATATMTSLGAPAAARCRRRCRRSLRPRVAAQWLGSQLTPQGTIDLTPGTASLSATAGAVTALGATGVDLPGARAGLSYLKANSATYITEREVTVRGSWRISFSTAHALGVNPTNFGGTNLVARLLATEQTSGPDVGRFGTDAQNAQYNVRHTTTRASRWPRSAAAGVKADAASVSWLVDQQCANGGWSDPDRRHHSV